MLDDTRPALSARRRFTWPAAIACVTALAVLPACGENKPDVSATPEPSDVASGQSAEPSASPTPTKPAKPVKASKNLDAIKVTGAAGKAPKVSFKAPWGIDQTRVKVLSEGTGPKVSPTGTIEVNYLGVNGRTGKTFDQSFNRGQTATFPLNGVIPGFKKGLENQRVGSRVLIAMPGKDGYDKSGGSPQAGIAVGDTLLFVVDIASTSLDKPEGQAVAVKDGLPQVSKGDGTPKVTIPKTDAPAKLQVAPVIKGSGRKVKASDAVTVRYAAWSWKSGKQVDSDYAAKAPETGQLSTLIKGWQQGLVGQPVGSRVLLVVPPDLAYPDGSEKPKVAKGETLVFVVDVLYAQPGQ